MAFTERPMKENEKVVHLDNDNDNNNPANLVIVPVDVGDYLIQAMPNHLYIGHALQSLWRNGPYEQDGKVYWEALKK